MIDIHSHILPGLDDGAHDIETTLKMAEIAAADGIKKVIATPHFISKEKEMEKELILEKVEEINNILINENIPLEILPGQEVFITPDVPELYEQGKILSLCNKGKYILLELPMMSIPVYTKEVIFNLNLKGVKTIIAHPERNYEIIKDLDKLNELVEIGALIQVNSLSLLGIFGKEVKDTALKILKRRYVSFIASDCHTARSRSPKLKGLLNIMEEKEFIKYCRENPLKILNNEDIETERNYGVKKEKGFFRKISAFFEFF